jgi:hypothetical protein
MLGICVVNRGEVIGDGPCGKELTHGKFSLHLGCPHFVRQQKTDLVAIQLATKNKLDRNNFRSPQLGDLLFKLPKKLGVAQNVKNGHQSNKKSLISYFYHYLKKFQALPKKFNYQLGSPKTFNCHFRLPQSTTKGN